MNSYKEYQINICASAVVSNFASSTGVLTKNICLFQGVIFVGASVKVFSLKFKHFNKAKIQHDYTLE